MKTAEQSAQKMSRTKKILLSILIAIVILIISLITYEAITVNKTYYIGEKNLKIPVFVNRIWLYANNNRNLWKATYWFNKIRL